jgi:hypothetical protein
MTPGPNSRIVLFVEWRKWWLDGLTGLDVGFLCLRSGDPEACASVMPCSIFTIRQRYQVI